jgi:F-type H+-transporting ATPase subunit alpha
MAAFAQFGSDLDASTQRLLNRGSKLTELLKQNQYSPLSVAEQVISVFSGVNGYLDDIDLGEIKSFESDLIDLMRSSHQDIINSINESGNLDDDIKDKLVGIIEEFKKSR